MGGAKPHAAKQDCQEDCLPHAGVLNGWHELPKTIGAQLAHLGGPCRHKLQNPDSRRLCATSCQRGVSSPVTVGKRSPKGYCGRPATSVFSRNSSDPMQYRHSAPRSGRRPLSRINRDSAGDSDPSTRTINSPGTNLSRRRVATSMALNSCFTRNLVVIVILRILSIQPVADRLQF